MGDSLPGELGTGGATDISFHCVSISAALNVALCLHHTLKFSLKMKQTNKKGYLEEKRSF